MILVTGGKGTIGRPLVKALKDKGHDVLAFPVCLFTQSRGFSGHMSVIEVMSAFSSSF